MRVMSIDFSASEMDAGQEWFMRHFGSEDVEFFFSASILEAVWGARNFCPDAIVLDGVAEMSRCDPVVSLLRRMCPDAEWFRVLEGRLIGHADEWIPTRPGASIQGARA